MKALKKFLHRNPDPTPENIIIRMAIMGFKQKTIVSIFPDLDLGTIWGAIEIGREIRRGDLKPLSPEGLTADRGARPNEGQKSETQP